MIKSEIPSYNNETRMYNKIHTNGTTATTTRQKHTLVRPRCEQASLSSFSLRVMICDLVGIHGNQAGSKGEEYRNNRTPPLLRWPFPFPLPVVVAVLGEDEEAPSTPSSFAIAEEVDDRGEFFQVSPGAGNNASGPFAAETWWFVSSLLAADCSERLACNSNTSKPRTRPSRWFFGDSDSPSPACSTLLPPPSLPPLRTDSEDAREFLLLMGKKKSSRSSMEGA